MKKFITYILLSVVAFSSFAQYSFQREKDKYWIYRERLKNFMVSSNGTGCKGCDIPAVGRENDGTPIVGTDRIGWADTPWFIGYWMGTLAMEYKLLKQSGLSSTSPEVMQTKEDLYGVIQSVNRLDWEAEESWGCSHCGNSYTPCPGNINGFLIADDIPNDFSQVQSIIDGLNEGLVPPKDDYRDKCVSSAFTEYLTPGREASQDHLIGLFLGLALVKQCLLSDENWNNTQFINGLSEAHTFSFAKEVQIISQRIINYLNSNVWIYMNPCAVRCVIGVYNDHVNPTPCGQLNPNDVCYFTGTGSPPNCCEGGGAFALPEAIGFAAANQFIQGNAPDPILTSLVSNPVYQFAWDQAINNAMDPSNNNRLPLTLAAIGNIWKVGICWQNVSIHFCWFPFCNCCILDQTLTFPIPVWCSSTTADISNHLINAGVNRVC